MKKLLLFLFVAMAQLLFAVNVTFQVNMAQQTVSASGVFVAGSFQGWNATASPMQDADGDLVYTFTADIAAGTAIEYKFINGSTWEQVPAACGVGGFSNRSLNVPNSDQVLDPVCFNACANCLAVTMLPVTFQVNMNEQTIDPNGVHVAGSFQGWNPASTALSDSDADGIYEVTVNMAEGETVNYKFINGNAWTGSESVPTACGVGDGFGGFNRSYVVSNTNPTIVCFGQCENCQTPGCMDNSACNYNANATTDDGSCLVIGTICDDGDNSTADDAVQNDCTCSGSPAIPTMVIFQVDMTNETVDATGVFVAGSFNGWDATATQMSEFQPGQYQAVAFVFPGETVSYKFINGSDWLGVETVPVACGSDDGSGNINRNLTVGTAAITTPMVCFSSCEACIPINMSSVTFTVDMTNETVSPNGVHIAGSFQNWDAAATPMTNNGNGLYAYTTNIPTGTTIQYKYINGNDWTGAEEVAFACAFNDGMGNYNRSHNVVPGNNNIGPVCFTQCEACQPTTVVVVRVDMSDETVSPNGVYFTTQLDNYNPTANAMNDLGGGIWEGSINVPANSDLFYRFVNGNTVDGFEMVPNSCGALDNAELQRFVAVGESNMIVESVCFSGCGNCIGISDDVTITFQMDASNIVVNANGIHIAGSFQGWDASTTPMTDLGNGIWSYSFTTNPNQTFQYKFINGNDWSGSEIVPAECGIDNGLGGFNREINIGTSSQTFTAVCFNECNPCNVGVNESMNTLEVYPNPFGDFLHLNGSVDGSLKIFNSIGQCVYSDNASFNHRISTAQWPMGIYTVINNHHKRKIIKH
jgi:Secretion system C-terminal sorting domain